MKMCLASKELDRISRGLNTKIAVHVADGNRRPKAPMQAAKLASEAGFALRDHIPILPRWKDYEDENNKDLHITCSRYLFGLLVILSVGWTTLKLLYFCYSSKGNVVCLICSVTS